MARLTTSHLRGRLNPSRGWQPLAGRPSVRLPTLPLTDRNLRPTRPFSAASARSVGVIRRARLSPAGVPKSAYGAWRILLSEAAARATMIEIRCGRCERAGRLYVARLLAEHGPSAAMGDVLRAQAAISTRCCRSHPRSWSLGPLFQPRSPGCGRTGDLGTAAPGGRAARGDGRTAAAARACSHRAGVLTAGETPEAAIAGLAARWPALRFVLRPLPPD